MDTKVIYAIGFTFIGFGLFLRWAWRRANPPSDSLTPSLPPDPTATFGNLLTAIGVLINIVTLVINVVGGPGNPPPTTAVATSSGVSAATSGSETTTKTSATTGTTAEERYPGFRPLPPKSPKRESGYPYMEAVCQSLGRPADAWVPGQIAPHSLDGRILHAHKQAYHWTCGGPFSSTHPRITRDQISQTCAAYNWGKAAYTWDPHYAYSWYCL